MLVVIIATELLLGCVYYFGFMCLIVQLAGGRRQGGKSQLTGMLFPNCGGGIPRNCWPNADSWVYMFSRNKGQGGRGR